MVVICRPHKSKEGKLTLLDAIRKALELAKIKKA